MLRLLPQLLSLLRCLLLQPINQKTHSKEKRTLMVRFFYAVMSTKDAPMCEAL